MTHRTTVAAIATRQDGLITLEQARQAGLSDHTVRGLRERKEWVPVLPRVYRVVESRETTSSRIRAVSLWASQPSCLSGISAAQWWGLVEAPLAAVEITVPRTRRLRPPPGIVVKRRFIPPEDRTELRGVALTGLALSSLHGAAALGVGGAAMLDRALQRRVSFAAVRAAHYRNLGCYGSHQAGLLLTAAGDRASAQSERLFIRLMKDAGVTGWQVNRRLELGAISAEVDFRFSKERLVVEIDGWAWHHQHDRFQNDRTKQNALSIAKWKVLRFTWFDLTERPRQVVEEVRLALSLVA